MTWGKTGELPGEMPALKWYHGPLCPNFHTSQLPIECRTNLTPGIWVHWSVAYGPLLQGLPPQLGDMTHLRWLGRGWCDGDVQCSRFASVPSGNKNVCWSGVIKVSSEAMASLYTNVQVGTTTEVDDLIPQAIVAYDNISPHACRSQHDDHEDQG